MTAVTTSAASALREPDAFEIRLLALVVPLALLAIWAIGSETGVLAPSVLPAPATVARTLWHFFATGEIWPHILASLRRVALGMLAGTALGLVLGIAMGLSRPVRDYLFPTFQALAYVPILAWLPILMLVLGLGEAIKVILIAKAVLVPVTLNAYNGVRDIPIAYVEVGRTQGLTRVQHLRHILLPAAFAPIWAGVRYGHSRAWTALLIVELLASSEGLGFLMVEGQQLLQLDVQLAAIIVLAVIGFALDRLLALPERWIHGWRRTGFHEVGA